MNPWHLSASELLIWGIVLHLIADWLLQNEWMANNKMKRARLGEIPGDGMTRAPSRMHPYSLWFLRHPAAYVHAGIHGILLSVVFGWAAVWLAIVHLLIDTRVPLVWWGTKVVKQTQPKGYVVEAFHNDDNLYISDAPLYDIGLEVRFWTDQVFHIFTIAVAALLVTL